MATKKKRTKRSTLKKVSSPLFMGTLSDKLPRELLKMTKAQIAEVIAFFAKLSEVEIRRRQDLNNAAMREAYAMSPGAQKDLAMANTQATELLLQAAMLKKDGAPVELDFAQLRRHHGVEDELDADHEIATETDGVQHRAAKLLGWSLADVRSMSLQSLRELLRSAGATELVQKIDRLIEADYARIDAERAARYGVLPVGETIDERARKRAEQTRSLMPLRPVFTVQYLMPDGVEIEAALTKQDAERRAIQLYDEARARGVWLDVRAQQKGVPFWYSPKPELFDEG